MYDVVVSGHGQLTAHFALIVHPITFIDFPFDSTLRITLSGTMGTLTIRAGHTGYLPSGTYRMTLHGGTIPGLEWFANANVTIVSDRDRSTLITIGGSASIYAVGEPALVPVDSPTGGGAASLPMGPTLVLGDRVLGGPPRPK